MKTFLVTVDYDEATSEDIHDGVVSWLGFVMDDQVTVKEVK